MHIIIHIFYWSVALVIDQSILSGSKIRNLSRKCHQILQAVMTAASGGAFAWKQASKECKNLQFQE